MITIDVDLLADALFERFYKASVNFASQWMTVAEAAEHMRCHHSWIRERLGEIPHVRIDGKILFDRHALDAWANQHRRGNPC